MQKYLDDISNGKRYTLSDMVRASCNDCAGCSACCEDMGDSILLDPLDLYQLTGHLHITFEQLHGSIYRAACRRRYDPPKSENVRQRQTSVRS